METMKERIDNTYTGRFYQILNRFLSKDPKKLVRKNWVEIFKPRTKADFHKCAGNMYQLISLSKQEVMKYIPDDTEILKEFAPLEALVDFSFNHLNGKTEAAQKNLDKAKLRHFRFVAMGISGTVNMDKVGELKLMSSILSELIEELTTKDIDPSLRKFVIKTTNEINDCLKTYKLFGIDDFDLLAFRTNGEFRQNEGLREMIEKDDTYRKLITILDISDNLNRYTSNPITDTKEAFSLNDLIENLQSLPAQEESMEEPAPEESVEEPAQPKEK